MIKLGYANSLRCDNEITNFIKIENLKAKSVNTDQVILKGINLMVREGEIHVIMGKNGSGKSTLSKVLVGHPDYEVISGNIIFNGKDLLSLSVEERSHMGLFLSFQSPIEIPGVNNIDFLRLAYNTKMKALGKNEMEPLEFCSFIAPKLKDLNMDLSFLNRNLNEGFSGGEKKRNEILQLAVLDPDMAILDEIDSGLDIDALRDVTQALNRLKNHKTSMLIITHYQRLLEYLRPDYVHIMQDGKIVKVGGLEIVKTLENEGYAAIR